MRKIYLPAKQFRLLIFSLSFFFSLIISVNTVGQNQQTYTSSGTFTYTVPAGVTQITVECWGGGGNGGAWTINGIGGGGGGGAYARKLVTVIQGNYTVTVGASGQDSWFGTNSTILAKGGSSPAGNTTPGASGGTAAGSIGNVVLSGGNGAASGANSGGGGSSAGTAANGNNAVASTGGAAPTGGGKGADGITTKGNGNSGNTPGGGGSGGFQQGAGGNFGAGAAGQVKISYYSLTGTSVATICQNSATTATLSNSTTTILPVGTYTVTYNLTGANIATGNTATMNVTTAGTGSFSTVVLPNSGSTTVTITNLASGIYSSSIGGTFNTANFTVSSAPQPTVSAGSATTFCAGGSVILTSSAASSYKWYNDGVLISGATSQTYSAITSAVYSVVVTNAIGCISSASSGTTVTVNSLPSTPTITPSGPTTFCADGSLTLTSSPATTYQWYKGGVLIIGATNISYPPNTNGTYTVVVKNSAGCISAPSFGTAVTVNPLPPIPTISGGPTTFCSGLNVVLSSSASSGNKWYDGIGLIPGATSSNYTASATSGYLVRVTDVNGCTSISSATNVTVNPLPDITLATQATSLCSSTSSQSTQLAYTNTNNSPTSYSIIWNAAALSAGFTNVTDLGLPVSPISITVPANVVANTYSGTLTAKNANGCQSSSKSFTVTVASSPNVSNFSISAVDGCAGTGAIVTVNSTSIGAGAYNVKYDLTGATVSSNNIATITFSGNTGTFTALASNVGATTVTITEVSLVGCATNVSSNNTASFTINALPAVPSITGPSAVCVGATITLNSSPIGGTWTSSQPSVGTVNSSGVVLGLINGTTVITYATAAVNGCTNKNTQNITVNALPVVQGITGQTSLCVGTTSTLANLTPNGAWSSSNTSVATIDNTGLVSAIMLGTTIITYTTPVDGNGCANSTNITVNISPDPVAIAGPDLAACESSSPASITLTGSSYSGGATSAVWTIDNGGGTLSGQGTGNSPATVTYTPAANFYGTITLRLTTNTVGTCGFATATRFINITQKPNAIVGSTITVCQNAFPTAIMLSDALVNGSATTGAWSIISGNGTLSDGTQRTDPANVSYTPVANYSGPVTLRLTTNAVGICGSAFTDRTINVTAIATANAGTQNSICQSASPGTVALTGASVGGGATTGAWTITQGSGTLSSNNVQTSNPASVTITPDANFSGTIKLTLTTNVPAGCTFTTAERIIDVTPASTITSGGSNTICQTASALSLAGANIGGGATTGTWSIVSGSGSLSSLNPETNPGTITFTPDGIYTGNVSLLLTTNATGNCPAVSANRTITISPNATIALSSAASTSSQTICIGQPITAITYLVGGGGSGATFAGLPAGLITSFNSGTVTISGTPTGSGPFNYSVLTTGSCSQTNATGTILVNPSTVGGTLSPSLISVCSGGNSGTITLTGNTGAVLNWERSINAGGSWTPITNMTSMYSTTVSQPTLFRAVIESGTGVGACAVAYSAPAQVIIDAPFTPAITAIAATSVCLGGTVSLTASGYTGSGLVITGGNFLDANPLGWNGASANNNNVTTNSPWGGANGPKTWNGVSYNSNPDKFMIVNGTAVSDLTTPVFSLVGLSSAYLAFNQKYNLAAGALAQVKISIDGGTTYTTLQTYTGSGPAPGILVGSTTDFSLDTKVFINLSSYLGMTNLKLQFLYTGSAGSNWAIDNVVVTNATTNPSGANAYNNVTYTWSTANYLSSTSGQVVTFNSAASGIGSFTKSVTTTTLSGCTGAPAGTVTITVNPFPTATISGTTAVCVGSASPNITFTGSTGTAPYTFTYKINGGSNTTVTTTSGNSVTVAVPTGTAGSFVYTLVSVQDASSSACSQLQTGTVTITVNPLPTATISGTTAVCVGSASPNITFTGSVGTAPYTFTYKINGGSNVTVTTVSGNSVTIAAPTATAGSFVYTLVSVQDASSTACTQLQTGTATVTVNPLPTATISGTTAVCVGSASPNITFTGFVGTAPYTFTYKIDGGSNVTVTTISGNSITVAASTGTAGSFVYSLVSVQDASSTACIQLQTGAATVTVDLTTVPGTLPSNFSACTAGGTTLTLSGNVGAITRWESSIDGGGTWTTIANVTTSNPITVSAQTTLYRVLVQSGVCASSYSSTTIAGLHNVWTGAINTNWQTAGNWSDGILPNTTCADVTIPNVTNKPVLSSGTSTITNLVVQSLARLTISGTGILQVAGTITNSGLFDVGSGTLEFNGSSAQSFSGGLFIGNAVKNLTVSNTNLTVSGAAIPLNITGELAFGAVSNADFKTGDHVVLVSNIAGTARVADITNAGTRTGNKFTGKVTVERYYPARRSWRLVTSPLSNTGSIFNNWQESAPDIYVPGKGTFITGPTPTAANGLDWSFQNHYSIKGWRASDGTYVNIGNTISTNLSSTASNAANIGYYLFVRGDRMRVPNDNTIIPNTNVTTLSSKGNLQTGTQTFAVESTPGTYTLIGNPFASSIDFTKITKVNVNPNRFYVYDPMLGTIGLFVVMEDLSSLGSFTPTVQTSSTQRNFIQSSQAFFVENNGLGASVTIEEQHKSNNYNPNLFRPAKPLNEIAYLRTNLLQLNSAGSNLVVDGFLAAYDNGYNSAVDILDALKFTNINENLGLKRDGKILCVERRALITADDTLFIQISRTTQRRYRLAFEPANLDPLLTAFLEDNYTGTKNVLSVTSNSDYDFEVNGDAASSATDRFRIVFKKPETGPLPVTYKNINAYQQQANIAVEWTVENELNISKYEVEKSTNGINYLKVNTSMAVGSGQNSTLYKWLDVNPVYGNNFYRIRSISFDGKFEYSKAVVVKTGKGVAGIAAYPNPVLNGIIGLAFNNMPGGIYKARLFNSTGQTILNKQINHASGTSLENIRPDYYLTGGIYKLEITTPDKTITIIKLLVK